MTTGKQHVPRCHSLVPDRVPFSSSPLLGNALIRNGEVNGAESRDAFVIFCSFSDTGRSSEKKMSLHMSPGTARCGVMLPPSFWKTVVPAAGHWCSFFPHHFKEALWKKFSGSHVHW